MPHRKQESSTLALREAGGCGAESQQTLHIDARSIWGPADCAQGEGGGSQTGLELGEPMGHQVCADILSLVWAGDRVRGHAGLVGLRHPGLPCRARQALCVLGPGHSLRGRGPLGCGLVNTSSLVFLFPLRSLEIHSCHPRLLRPRGSGPSSRRTDLAEDHGVSWDRRGVGWREVLSSRSTSVPRRNGVWEEGCFLWENRRFIPGSAGQQPMKPGPG